ncbi:hypothetical protein AAMO2058_000424400 [Amorphochlora amoebiformis]
MRRNLSLMGFLLTMCIAEGVRHVHQVHMEAKDHQPLNRTSPVTPNPPPPPPPPLPKKTVTPPKTVTPAPIKESGPKGIPPMTLFSGGGARVWAGISKYTQSLITGFPKLAENLNRGMYSFALDSYNYLKKPLLFQKSTQWGGTKEGKNGYGSQEKRLGISLSWGVSKYVDSILTSQILGNFSGLMARSVSIGQAIFGVICTITAVLVLVAIVYIQFNPQVLSSQAKPKIQHGHPPPPTNDLHYTSKNQWIIVPQKLIKTFPSPENKNENQDTFKLEIRNQRWLKVLDEFAVNNNITPNTNIELSHDLAEEFISKGLSLLKPGDKLWYYPIDSKAEDTLLADNKHRVPTIASISSMRTSGVSIPPIRSSMTDIESLAGMGREKVGNGSRRASTSASTGTDNISDVEIRTSARSLPRNTPSSIEEELLT